MCKKCFNVKINKLYRPKKRCENKYIVKIKLCENNNRKIIKIHKENQLHDNKNTCKKILSCALHMQKKEVLL